MRKWLPILILFTGACQSSTDLRRASRPDTFPWPRDQIEHYTAYQAAGPIRVDGRLHEESWRKASRSPRFRDLVSGARTIRDTRAAVLWDDEYLYVGFWVEEPHVRAKLTQQDSYIYTENDVEVFIAGKDAYYEFEINALGTIYEALFVWEDGIERSGYDKAAEFQRDMDGGRPFDGVGFKHPRGPRIGYFDWDFAGLEKAVHVDGTLNDDHDRDRGWTVELAFPWKSMESLARSDGRALPPEEGEVWRIDFSRFNQYKESPPVKDSGGWAWSPHGVWDSHIPELFPYIHFSKKPVDAE